MNRLLPGLLALLLMASTAIAHDLYVVPASFRPAVGVTALKPGETLPVRVLVRGALAAGLEIRTASSAAGAKIVSSGTTGADGRISIPVVAGQYRLHALHMERVTDGSADWESFWGTLTFEIR